MRYLAAFVLGILFSGCQEKFPVYSSFCEQDERTFPKCLHYAVFNEEERDMIASAFGMKEDEACPYRVELTKYHIGNCDNPTVKSLGSDFDGYVRLEIKKDFKCYYKIQSDFKNDESRAFQRVLKKIEEERNFTK